MATQAAEPRAGEETGLERVLGPFLLVLFIIGDIIGAGIFAVTGKIAGEVGGLAWLPFLLAFAIATLTAFSYLELVTKHPRAAGAALYVHEAFGIHFVTLLVAFVVACSSITSASTSSGLLASDLLVGLDEIVPGVPTGDTASLLTALGFMLLLAAVNLRGVGESVRFTTALALGLITYVRTQSGSNVVSALSGTTGLLLLAVFAVVNVTCLVLRREDTGRGFRAPTAVPVLGAVLSAFLVGPWARNPADYIQYRIAAALVVLGVVLWAITWLVNRRVGSRSPSLDDASQL